MGIGTEVGILLAYAFGLIILYLIAYILLVPIKWIIRLVINGVVGGVILLGLNFLGNFLNFHITLNPLTALITGILGVPGLIMLFLFKYIIT